ncbi:MAG: hypothetical protein U9R36_06445, partial [Elusimicrobiota bacterium]|nr:hypothetical protein [Elusimicrobiota bacterium]
EIASLIAKHTDGGIPDFTFRSVEPKTYLLIAGSKFGLITLPPANTFRGTAGLYALREQYTLTVESIRKMIQLLNDGGFIYIPVWTDQPPRAPLKLLATISQSLELESLLPQRHLAAVRDWNMIHFMVSKSPFSESQLALMEKFSREKKFDIILPEKLGSGPDKFHKFGKDDFVFSVSRILSGKRENFIAGYKFNISPPTDDRPFFLNFLTFRAARHIIRTGSFRDFSFIELGYMIMIAAFFQVSFAAVILIILPLFKIKKKLKNKFFSITYFSCLGLGFIFLEMVFIQKFTLYFGSPVSAAGFVMAFMLGTSGLGSYTSSKFNATAGNILKVCFCVFLAVLAVSLILDSVIYRTIGAFPGIKALIAFAVIFPAAFLMGMPFPLGLKFIGKKDVSNIPWCWGIDGSLSVIGAVLASIISVNLGFSAVMFSVIVLYLAAALSTVSAGQ